MGLSRCAKVKLKKKKEHVHRHTSDLEEKTSSSAEKAKVDLVLLIQDRDLGLLSRKVLLGTRNTVGSRNNELTGHGGTCF